MKVQLFSIVLLFSASVAAFAVAPAAPSNNVKTAALGNHFQSKTGNLDIHLKRSHPFSRTSYFEVHIP